MSNTSLFTVFFNPVGGNPAEAFDFRESGPEYYAKLVKSHTIDPSNRNGQAPSPDVESDPSAGSSQSHNTDSSYSPPPTNLEGQSCLQQDLQNQSSLIIRRRWEEVNASPFPEDISTLNFQDQAVLDDLRRVLGNSLFRFFSYHSDVHYPSLDGSNGITHGVATYFYPAFCLTNLDEPIPLTWDHILGIEVASYVRGDPRTKLALTPSGAMLWMFDIQVVRLYLTRCQIKLPLKCILRVWPILPVVPPLNFDTFFSWNTATGKFDKDPTVVPMTQLFLYNLACHSNENRCLYSNPVRYYRFGNWKPVEAQFSFVPPSSTPSGSNQPQLNTPGAANEINASYSHPPPLSGSNQPQLNAPGAANDINASYSHPHHSYHPF